MSSPSSPEGSDAIWACVERRRPGIAKKPPRHRGLSGEANPSRGEFDHSEGDNGAPATLILRSTPRNSDDALPRSLHSLSLSLEFEMVVWHGFGYISAYLSEICEERLLYIYDDSLFLE